MEKKFCASADLLLAEREGKLLPYTEKHISKNVLNYAKKTFNRIKAILITLGLKQINAMSAR